MQTLLWPSVKTTPLNLIHRVYICDFYVCHGKLGLQLGKLGKLSYSLCVLLHFLFYDVIPSSLVGVRSFCPFSFFLPPPSSPRDTFETSFAKIPYAYFCLFVYYYCCWPNIFSHCVASFLLGLARSHDIKIFRDFILPIRQCCSLPAEWFLVHNWQKRHFGLLLFPLIFFFVFFFFFYFDPFILL